MEKREKAEFLLEQVRLCLSQRDFVRMQIIANKVSKKVLDEEGFEVRFPCLCTVCAAEAVDEARECLDLLGLPCMRLCWIVSRHGCPPLPLSRRPHLLPPCFVGLPSRS
jgi:hypothetical protein